MQQAAIGREFDLETVDARFRIRGPIAPRADVVLVQEAAGGGQLGTEMLLEAFASAIRLPVCHCAARPRRTAPRGRDGTSLGLVSRDRA
jgi:hypothetical protein